MAAKRSARGAQKSATPAKKPAVKRKPVAPAKAKVAAPAKAKASAPAKVKVDAPGKVKTRTAVERTKKAAPVGKPAKQDAAPVAPVGPSRAETVRAGRVSRPEPAAISVGAGDLDAEPDPVATAKLAIGPAAEGLETPTQIPWSYGHDRVTAAAIDPERLFVYWEVTDQAIERARGQLGKGGAGAWLDLRVYDTTGLIFDGTNANSYFDHAVDRSSRQWFFQVGRPTSTAFVELGMRSSEGYFARIVRSGRVDFPRREPAGWGDPEWMTVRPGGDVAGLHRSSAPHRGGGGGGGAPGGWTADGESYWVMREPGGVHESVLRQLVEHGWERVEWSDSSGEGWYALEGRVEWESPRVLSTWEAGPFSHPVEIQPPQREVREGKGFAYRVGNVTHVVEGPWRVTIRNVGAHSERAVIATWEIHRSWSTLGGRSVRVAGRGIGGSEQVWLQGSEVRMGGASERWRVGASEIAWKGASERLLAGASQWRYGGASERAWAGASEYRLGGASERAYAGASERRLGGASERVLGGGSEHAHAGGSEVRFGGSEQRFEGPTAPPLPWPPVEPASGGREG